MSELTEFSWGGEIVWTPSPAYSDGSHVTRFMERHNISTWDELHRRSIGDVAWFTDAMLTYLGIEFATPYKQIVDLSKGNAWPVWCVDGVMNITHNCLDRWLGTEVERKVALRYESEAGDVKTLTYGELHQKVGQVAAGLRALGLGKGDAIALYMPMIPEIAIAMLAIARIGGIILPLFSGYGAGAVATRLADADATAIFTTDGTWRRGRRGPMKPTVDEALLLAPGVEHVIVCDVAGDDITMEPGRDLRWDDLLRLADKTVDSEPTAAEDVVMIIYTSGTTGRPKGAVHTHCGFPLKAAMDMALGLDLRRDDTLYWMTDMGWMMGPWEVFGTLLLGATMLFYDGAPDFPDVDRLWSLVERHRITTLGVSPTLIRSLMQHGEEPVRRHDLSSLRIMASTGEPWNPEPWLWLFNTVGGGQCPIINYSGGTEISGGIVMGNVLKPLKPCAFSGPNVGMAADVVDDRGNSVRGQVGELVVRAPWIGMTRGFWKDPERYIETYWSRFPNVWVHGDWAAIDSDGQWYILGRSDDTIKVAGKRLGPAEVETILVNDPRVIEAGAIGVPDELKGQALVVFCVLSPDVEATDELAAALKAKIIAAMGKPLTPKAVVFVPDLPKTRNAKVMRRVLRAAWLDEPAGDLSALVNPEVVDTIRRAGSASSH